MVNIDNPVVKLCIEGTQAEYHGKIDKARALYQRAWDITQDDYEACIAAHYVARHQEEPHERLRWNRIALDRANTVGDDRTREFYPSLYINMGHSYEMLGELETAKRYYDQAAELGIEHQSEKKDALLDGEK
jgi:tetratricopeptide (TPR) repeat protein